MNFLRVLRLEAGRFNVKGITYKNKPNIFALQIKNGEYNHQHKRDYKNFGHKRPEPQTSFSKFYCALLCILFTGPLLDWKWYVSQYQFHEFIVL